MKKIFSLLLVAMVSMTMSATRTYLIQTAWDQENYNSMMPRFTSDSTAAVSGCTTIAAAQVINYYGWLPEYDTRFKIDVTDSLMGFPEGSTEVKDPKFDLWYWTGTYHVDSMPCSTDSLITSIFYSEASLIERTNGTSTSPWVLYGCFSNHYGYDIEAYVTDEYEDAAESVFCEIVSTAQQKLIVQQAIEAGKPVIVNGTMHSFIIDGYDRDSDQYHFNLGWGPDHIFWGPYNSWGDGRYSVFIVTPNRTKERMPEIAVSDSIPLHIRNIDTQEDHVGYIINEGEYFYFEDHFNENMTPGSYEIWIQFPDSTILAPQLPNNLKSFADGSTGIVAYNFMHNKAIFNVDDRENYGFVLNATIYYKTQFGYFNIQYQEMLTEQALDSAEITAVVNGQTYKMVNHNDVHYTAPIRIKRGDVVEWLAYYKNLPYGNDLKNTVSFDIQDEYIMLAPSNYNETNNYAASYVDNERTLSSATLGSLASYNNTKPFKFKAPSQLYLLDEENYPYYEGSMLGLDSIESEYVYMGIEFSSTGAHIFVYNRVPIEYDMTTGVSFVIDNDTTTYSLAPGSPIPAAPADPTKPGYDFKYWSPEIVPNDTVTNGIKEYFAVFEKGNYETYGSLNHLVYSLPEPAGQGVFVELNERIDSIALSAEGVREGIYTYAYPQSVKIRCTGSTPNHWRALGTIAGTVFGYWNMINGIPTFTIASWEGVHYTPGPLLPSGDYYLYNLGAQAYVNIGAIGMPAILDGAGTNIRFSIMGSEYYVYHYDNQTGQTFLSENGWMDYSTSDFFVLEEAGDSAYYLKIKGGNYCYWAGGLGEHGDEVRMGEQTATPACQWKVIPTNQRKALSANADATYYIANPDFSASATACSGWTGEFTTDSATAALQPLYSGLYAKKQTADGSLDSAALSQTITLPSGHYRLTVNAAAESNGTAATNAFLYAGNAQTAIGQNGSYYVDFNAGGRPVEIGIKAENSSAQLISLDKVRLTYLGEPTIVFPTMTITYDTAAMAITYTPSDKNAYYLVTKERTANLPDYDMDPDTYHQKSVNGYTWEDVKDYFRSHLYRGDTTIYLSDYISYGWAGDWTTFTNFIDSATLITSATTTCEFVLKLPVITFPTMTITYNPNTLDLTFTPSDKSAYYLICAESNENLMTYRKDPDTYHQQIITGYPWDLVVEYFEPRQGDVTVNLQQYIDMGWTGYWTAFANFVHRASKTVSATTTLEFVLTDVPTDISEVEVDENSVIYDILGRRVSEMLPGHIYIIDGEKVLKH